MTPEEKRQAMQYRLDAEKTAQERNLLGQFSTPYPLALDIMRYVKHLIPDGDISFLEPAVGTGVFYSAFQEVFGRRDHTATGFEIDPYYGEPARSLWQTSRLKIRIADFFDVPVPQKQYSLLVSNPPYSRHHHIPSDRKRELQHRVQETTGLRLSGLAGLYCHFLMLASQWVRPSGVSAWLVPMEFMDVNYGAAVKSFLLRNVNLLHIHRFFPEDLQFSDAQVTSAIVVFTNEPPSDVPITFSLGGELTAPNLVKRIDRKSLDPQRKWTPLFFDKNDFLNKTISPHDLGCLNQRKIYREESESSGPILGDFFWVKRGVATGNNQFFLLDEVTIRRYAIPEQFLTPVLPGPRHIAANIIERAPDGRPLLSLQRFLFRCDLPYKIICRKYPKMAAYIEAGEQAGVSGGYLCSRRKPWYATETREPAPIVVPYMGRQKSRKNPFRFILNESNAVATNVFLMLYPKPHLARSLNDTESLKVVWEGLNRLSPKSIADNGRVYGGGLYKMEPKELAAIPVGSFSVLLGPLRERQSHLF